MAVREDVRADFDAFVRDRSGRLLRLAYMYTRDHALAEDLLQTAYARCWRVWHRIEGDPEPYVRKALVNAYNSWWRRRSSTEEPSAALPDRAGDVPPQRRYDDRDEVWQAVRRLPRQQQAVLVLRYFEDLSEAQIAAVLDISPGSVKGYAAKALAKLRVDPTLSEFALPDMIPVTPGAERVAGVRTRIEQARRTRTATVVAAVAVAVSLLAGLLVGFGLGQRADHPVQPKPTPSGTAQAIGAATYFGGKQLVRAFPVQDLAHADGDFTWTPVSDQPFWIAVECVEDGPSVSLSGPKVIMAMLSFPGKPGWVGGSCQHGLTISDPQWYKGGQLGGFDRDPALRPVAGVPMTFHVRIGYSGHGSGGNDALPADSGVHGQWAVAVLQEVPWDEYPFPTHPAALNPLPSSLPYDGPRIDPAHLRTVTVAWKKTMAVSAVQQTPGRLTIRVNDVPAAVLTNWDYTVRRQTTCLSDAHLDLREGDQVAISIWSEDTEGDWYVIVDPVGIECPAG